jgi:hypothetical protein
MSLGQQDVEDVGGWCCDLPYQQCNFRAIFPFTTGMTGNVMQASTAAGLRLLQILMF